MWALANVQKNGNITKKNTGNLFRWIWEFRAALNAYARKNKENGIRTKQGKIKMCDVVQMHASVLGVMILGIIVRGE